MTRRHQLRSLAIAAVALFAFELFAFTDLDGVRADDLDLIVAGSASSGLMPPPNIVFYVDSSASMHNLICEDLSGALCDETSLVAHSAPNDATVCKSSILAALTAPPPAGGDATAYSAPYAADGTTYASARYPIFDTRASGATDDLFPTGATYGHGWNMPWWQVTLGTGLGAKAQIDSAIAQVCDFISDCEQKSRCVYSLRTLGYYWEPEENSCAAGDPMSLGCTGGGPSTPTVSAWAGWGRSGFLCDNGSGTTSACNAGTCSAHGGGSGLVCNACMSDADCESTDGCETTSMCSSYPFNICVKASKYGDCSEGLTPYGRWESDGNPDEGAPWGVFCSAADRCHGGHCAEHGGNTDGPNVCDECLADSDCATGTCNTTDTACPYSYCSDSGCASTPPADPGPWTGPPVQTCACDTSPCTDDNCEVPEGATCGELPPPQDPPICDTASIHPSVTYGSNLVVGCGAQIKSGAVLGDNVTIGAGATINASAVIGDNVYIGANVEIKNSAVVGDNAYIGDNSVVKAQDELSSDVCIGEDTEIKAKTDIGQGATIGSGVVIHAGVVIGAGATVDDGARLKSHTTIPVGGHVEGGAGDTDDLPIFLGDFLNFYPPKGVSLVKVIHSLGSGLPGDARIGFSDLNDTGGSVAAELSPACSDITGATVTDCFDEDTSTTCYSISSAEAYLRTCTGPAPLDSSCASPPTGTRYLTFDGGTPVATKLDNLSGYFMRSSGATAICSYDNTDCDANNFVVAISDGLPSGDAATTDGLTYTPAATLPGSETLRDGYYQTNQSLLDDVAKALTVIDHRGDLDNDQVVGTYVVSYGVVDPTDSTRCAGLLQTTATAGTGTCLTALNVSELQSALTAVVADIVERSTGFTAPSLSTTRKTATTVNYQAGFRPVDSFPLWEGHLFSFKVCDEALAARTGGSCSCFDGSRDDEVCVQGATDNQPVTFDSEGHLATGDPYWDAQLCLSGDAAGSLGSIKQDQFNLAVSSCYLSAADRVIYTAVEKASPDDELTSDDQIAFTADNVSDVSGADQLLAALGVGGVVATGQNLVNFYRGLDVTDADGDGNRAEDRNLNNIRDGEGVVDGWWKLGEAFHSIPTTVERPVGNGVGAWGKKKSYEAFMDAQTARKKVVLVGANDGMLHAFHAGTWSSGNKRYDTGTGKELWAFLSPELLPRLKTYCDAASGGCGLANHGYLVDGSIMVRDIWTGGTADKDVATNSSKWKTVAIYGHRRGGMSYVALDITDIESPTFLWQFPQAKHVDGSGTSLSSRMGQSWLETYPAAASIGPLQIDSDGDGRGDYDRWVTMLSGGYDPLDAKGNMLFIVDAYTGELLALFDSSGSGDLVHMDYSFAATPVFYPQLGADLPYIAGIVAADHGGQVWHIRTPPATLTSGRIDNFTPQVVFRTVDPPVAPDAGANNVIALSEYQPRPLFYAPALTLHGQGVRAIFASGDRDMMIPDGDRQIQGGSITAEVNSAVCSRSGGSVSDTYVQRLFAVDLAACTDEDGARPCNEDDLQEVSATDNQYATAAQHGWFLKLPAKEKSAAPYDIFEGYALYATFLPTWPCDSNLGTCNPREPGQAYLYARNIVSGKTLDWNDDGSLDSSEESVALGAGVPSAPSISVAMADGQMASTLFATTSGGDSVTKNVGESDMATAVDILHFPVSREWDQKLHDW